MKERAGDMPAPAARIAERLPLRIGEIKKPFIGAPRNQRRVVEFMPAYGAACSPERAVGKKPCFPVAQAQFALGETRRVSKQASHGMALSLGVLQAFPQHHVAAAFAVDRAGRAESPQAIVETKGVCKLAGMKLWIAAGKPAGIALIWGWLVGQRRERNDLGTGAPPALAKMRIHEREGCIRRNRDTLSGGRQCRGVIRSSNLNRRRAGYYPVEIKIMLRHVGKTIKSGCEIAVLCRLHKAEMSFRHG